MNSQGAPTKQHKCQGLLIELRRFVGINGGTARCLIAEPQRGAGTQGVRGSSWNVFIHASGPRAAARAATRFPVISSYCMRRHTAALGAPPRRWGVRFGLPARREWVGTDHQGDDGGSITQNSPAPPHSRQRRSAAARLSTPRHVIMISPAGKEAQNRNQKWKSSREMRKATPESRPAPPRHAQSCHAQPRRAMPSPGPAAVAAREALNTCGWGLDRMEGTARTSPCRPYRALSHTHPCHSPSHTHWHMHTHSKAARSLPRYLHWEDPATRCMKRNFEVVARCSATATAAAAAPPSLNETSLPPPFLTSPQRPPPPPAGAQASVCENGTYLKAQERRKLGL